MKNSERCAQDYNPDEIQHTANPQHRTNYSRGFMRDVYLNKNETS